MEPVETIRWVEVRWPLSDVHALTMRLLDNGYRLIKSDFDPHSALLVFTFKREYPSGNAPTIGRD